MRPIRRLAPAGVHVESADEDDEDDKADEEAFSGRPLFAANEDDEADEAEADQDDEADESDEALRSRSLLRPMGPR